MSPRCLSLLALSLAACFQPGGSATKKVIGPAGGTITTVDGRASLTIPAGALASGISISIARASAMSPLPKTRTAGPAYAISPAVSLAVPARVRLPIDATSGAAEVESSHGGKAVALSASPDGTSQVTALTRSLGTFQAVRLVITPTPDAGPADAGIPDAGFPDAGVADAGALDAGAADGGGSCSEALPDLSDVLRWNDAGIGGCNFFNATPCRHVGYACQTFASSCPNGGGGLAPGQVTTGAGWCVIVSDGGPCPGWPCQSDANCNAQERCTAGHCQELSCPPAPSCPAACTAYQEPHGCSVCVCDACPTDDGGVPPLPPPDAG